MWFNPLMSWLLRSRLHGMLSKGIMLVTVVGKKSGKVYTTPVNYVRDGATLWVASQRDRTWWRNLTGGAPISVRLAGREVQATGEALVEVNAVASNLRAYLQKVPQYAKYFGVALDPAGKPVPEDCAHAAQERVMIRIDLG